MKDNKVVIVGGGVIGLCSAYYALKRGFTVTVIEREPPGADNCSMGNAGMIVPSHFTPLAAPGMISKGLRWMLNPESPFYVRPRADRELMRWGWLFYKHSSKRHVEACQEVLRDLNLESRRLFAELNSEQDFGLQQRGLLMLCKTAKGLDGEAEVSQIANRIGLKSQVIDAASAAKLDPDITMDIAGAVYFPEDCHLDPARFMATMRQRVTDLGGHFESGVEVDQIKCQNNQISSISGGGRTFTGDQFLFAGGSWLPKLLDLVRVKLPVQAGKGYSLTLPAPPELPQLCSIFAEAKVAITPMGNCLRFGGTMEIGGLNQSINPARVRGIIKSVQSYFPKFSEKDFDGIEPWVGLRPVSPDGMPYLGRVDELSNLFVAGGHAMMGVSLGPVTGQLIAEQLAGVSSRKTGELLRPSRFN